MDNVDVSFSGGKVRLFVEAGLGCGVSVPASPQQEHYLLHVMRAHHGDCVRIFNGRDGEWLARIAEVERRACVLRCERQTAPQTTDDDLWLVFAPIKKTPSDYLAQKATELGVSVLQPVATRRTVVHRVNIERMRANAIEAAEQSGRLSVPEVRAPVTLEQVLAQWPAERALLFCDETGAPPILAALARESKNSWAVLIGPEGGFDKTERQSVRANPSAVPVSLGRRILRADTAALAALAILQAQRANGS